MLIKAWVHHDIIYLVSQGNMHKQISDRLRDAQSKRRIQKAELDLVNQKRDTRVAEINALQLEFEVNRNVSLCFPPCHLSACVFLRALLSVGRRSGRGSSHSWFQNNRDCVRSCKTSASTNSRVGDKCLLSRHTDRLVTGRRSDMSPTFDLCSCDFDLPDRDCDGEDCKLPEAEGPA